MAKSKKTRPAKQSRASYDVPAEEFVKAWQSSASLDEAAEKLKMPKPIASARAGKYRKVGIKLKVLRRGPGPEGRLDVKALNALIDQMARDAGGSPTT